jgi:hypothetical protein
VIRLLVPSDFPFMWELAQRRLPDRVFASEAAQEWFLQQVLIRQDLYLPIRTSDAFLIAMLSLVPWNLSSRECLVLFLVTDEHAIWQGLSLLRGSIKWAKMSGAAHWHIWHDHSDAGILARRVGAKLNTPRYRLDLT